MDVYEFGTYRGESLRLIEELFYAYQLPLRKAWGFDSFEGLPPEEEGVPRFYLFAPGMFADVGRLHPTRNATFIKGWFDELTPDHVRRHGMRPAALVHIDSDLYISAVQALEFVFSNNLVVPGTVIAYDEFRSTEDPMAGGESRAHMEVLNKYKVVATEFYRNVYRDQGAPDLDCWQNTFVVESIGQGEPT